MPRIAAFSVVLLFSYAAPATAQWAYFGDERKLMGSMIADVGTVEHAEQRAPLPPPTMDYGLPPIQRTMRFVRFTGEHTYCFRDDQGISLDRRAGLILVDSSGRILLAIIESSVGSVSVKVVPAERITCP